MRGDVVPYSILRVFFLISCLVFAGSCTSFQPTKNVWKTTKGLWNTYVSPPASVDYEDKGDLSPAALSLSQALMGIDIEMGKLERTMQNADKPPTQEWLNNLFASFPWLNGFAGVKYDGTILGQEPPDSLKQLDFIPLLYEDKKQNSRALRADVQPGPLGPEIMLAVPLYDGMDFLGIVVAYFDMRSLMRFSDKANDIVALSPGALLWPGKYEFAATPLAGVDWAKVVRESTAGTCSNSTGTFFYMVRYLGNLPIVFAVPSKGTFPEGNGDLEQGNAYFPQEREKLPPPPMPERKPSEEKALPVFEQPAPPEPEPQPETPPMPQASDRNVIPAGSRDSVLLKGGKPKARRQVQERQLEGENVEVVRVPERRQRPQQPKAEPLELLPEHEDGPTLPGGRPSPFGPGRDASGATRPSPFGPPDAQSRSSEQETSVNRQDTPAQEQGASGAVQEEAATPEPQTPKPRQEETSQSGPGSGESEQPAVEKAPPRPATLPGGRPSPFGPRD